MPYRNASGTVAYRVSGWLDGERIRKNYRDRAEAAAEKSSLEIQSLQATSGLRATTTLLTEEQLREAEAAFQRLKEKSQSLTVYLDFAFANYRAPQRERLLSEAMVEYVALKKCDKERKLLSLRQFRSIENELTKFNQTFPKAVVSQFTPDKLTPFMDRNVHDRVTPSLKTYNNRRGILSTFFKYAFQKDWIATNPVEKTRYHRINHKRGSAQTLTADKARDLMAYVENFRGGILTPYFAICLFAGIRPCLRFGEINKLKPESIMLDTGVIHIEPEVSKVAMKRVVAIQPNLAAWLRSYPISKYTIIPKNAVNDRVRIFKKFGLSHDILRHTFISMFVAKFRSMGEAALQAGNSESIIRKHYLDVKSQAEAEIFFGIMPTNVAEASTAPKASEEPRRLAA